MRGLGGVLWYTQFKHDMCIYICIMTCDMTLYIYIHVLWYVIWYVMWYDTIWFDNIYNKMCDMIWYECMCIYIYSICFCWNVGSASHHRLQYQLAAKTRRLSDLLAVMTLNIYTLEKTNIDLENCSLRIDIPENCDFPHLLVYRW